MIPAAFDYLRAHTTDEAFAHLQQHGAEARVLAGGQSLIPAMRFRLARPAVLVDINSLTDLGHLRISDQVLAVGAIARDSDIERAPWIGERRWSLIHDASRVVADPVVRQMGTVVGSLCHNDPAGDWTAVALASRATVVVRGTGRNPPRPDRRFPRRQLRDGSRGRRDGAGRGVSGARRSHGRVVPESRAQGRRLRHRCSGRAGVAECRRHDPGCGRGAVGGRRRAPCAWTRPSSCWPARNHPRS